MRFRTRDPQISRRPETWGFTPGIRGRRPRTERAKDREERRDTDAGFAPISPPSPEDDLGELAGTLKRTAPVARGTLSHVLARPFARTLARSAPKRVRRRQRERVQQRPAFGRSASRLPARGAG